MTKKRKFKVSKITLTALAFALFFFTLNLTQTSCGDGGPKIKDDAVTDQTGGAKGPIQPVLSGIVPGEVSVQGLDSNATPTQARPFFDRFSWQTFIALCWPVAPGQRGVPLKPNDPNTFLNMTNSTPVVWTSYKNQWDLFGQGTKTPSPWNSWDSPGKILSSNPTHVFFGSVNSQQIAGEIDESFSVPLVDQNKNYALFEIRYNELQYNFILSNGLYLRKNLVNYQINHGDNIIMPMSSDSSQGSILVKAAWKLLTPKDDQSRYYVVNDLVYNPITNSCSKQLLGLVGLHIAQKVDQFPQWVWSSFEQVDNVPGDGAKAPYSFNNGTGNPNTGDHGYANKPGSPSRIQDSSKRIPVQVNRLNPIPVTPAGASTVDINKIYQNAVRNTWMKYYQLVITQWPSNSTQFVAKAKGGIYPQDCGQAFPATGCVNTTMETYFQSPGDAVGAGGNSCMSCHYVATTDFSWSLQLRSHK